MTIDQQACLRPVEPMLRAATALRARPGGYAVLVGAGISRPTGMPTAWEVLETLVRRAAAARGEDPEDPSEWWRSRAGREPTYPAVLGEIASTADERRAVLAPFFERSEEDFECGRKLPSAGHRAIASLARRGLVRIMLTTNFDLLLEEALRDVGLAPVSLSSASSVAQMEPLHTQRCLVVHLHGDYLNPGVRNTEAELAGYEPPLAQLVERVVEEYGLLIAGWSAAWDIALADLIRGAESKRYSTWWIEPGALNPTQIDLIAKRSAEVVPLTADDALGRLESACDALDELERRSEPLSIAVAVANAKRELQSGRSAIRTHDTLRSAINRLSTSKLVHPDSYDGDTAAVQARADELLATMEPIVALVSTLAYWGDDGTDRWWFGDIERLTRRPHVSGLSSMIHLSRAPGLLVMYAAGVAAVAAERWALVERLLTEPMTENSSASHHVRVAAALNPEMSGVPGGSQTVFGFIVRSLTEHLGIDVDLAADAWERFEYLHAVTSRAKGGGRWMPYTRVEGIGPNEGRATADVWFDANVSVLSASSGGARWLSALELSDARAAFGSDFAELARQADYRLLPRGSGFLPSSRHYPGRFDDAALPPT